uniref:E2F_CC-MB domain-containing protein n=1 Tax=Heterorhabditis bacteriophora TaxID=37862 RepID=A0A1I7X6H9_HETBA
MENAQKNTTTPNSVDSELPSSSKFRDSVSTEEELTEDTLIIENEGDASRELVSGTEGQLQEVDVETCDVQYPQTSSSDEHIRVITKSKYSGHQPTSSEHTEYLIHPTPTKKVRRSAGLPVLMSVSQPQSVTMTEVARRSGRPTVVHPMMMECHIVRHVILYSRRGGLWNTILWLSISSKYIYNININHTDLLKEYDEAKEKLADDLFTTLFLMVREGENLTEDRVVEIQKAAYAHLQKFHRMRFKVPEIVARQRVQRESGVQTFVTMAAPQTMATAPVKYMSMNHHGPVKVVRMSNGELAQVSSRYIMDQDVDTHSQVGELIEVDIVDAHEMDDVEHQHHY